MSDVCNVCMWVLEQAVIFEPAPYPALSALIKLFHDSDIPHVIREGLCHGVGGIHLPLPPFFIFKKMHLKNKLIHS
jgi:hypothetical protein